VLVLEDLELGNCDLLAAQDAAIYYYAQDYVCHMLTDKLVK
jgi:hypothetical protein